MHAMKTSWPGRTFALANSNESGGKGARIRRSKEERKGMAESFIKQYQCLNNGNFPSLNLTHKEVGGSFYTVREIVREIIQENRVLGPGKWSEEEQKAEKFLEQHPLGSISIEPESSQSTSASGNNVLSRHGDGGSDESVLVVDELVVECEKEKTENEIIIDESTMNLKDESDEVVYTEVEVNGIAVELKGEGDEEVSAEFNVNRALKDETENEIIAELRVVAIDSKHESDKDIKAEFEVNGIAMELDNESDKAMSAELEINEALKDVSDTEVSAGLGTNGIIMESKDSSDQIVSLEMEVNGVAMDLEDETDKEIIAELGTKELLEETREVPTHTTAQLTPAVTSEANGGITQFTSTSRVIQMPTDVIVETFPIRPSISQKEAKNTTDMLSEKKSALVDSNPPVEASKQLTSRDSELQGGQNGSTLKVDVSNHDNTTSKTNEIKTTNEKATSSPNELPKTNATGESTTKGATVVEKNITSIQPNTNSRKGSSATLDRINLESWEGTAKGKRPSETNALMAIFKSFITAFVKFWSE